MVACGFANGRRRGRARRAGPAWFHPPIEPSGPCAMPTRPRWAALRRPVIAGKSSRSDLIAAVLRFNRRWTQFLGSFNLGSDQYRDRAVQSLLRPREGVRHGFGSARGPPFQPRGAVLTRPMLLRGSSDACRSLLAGRVAGVRPLIDPVNPEKIVEKGSMSHLATESKTSFLGSPGRPLWVPSRSGRVPLLARRAAVVDDPARARRRKGWRLRGHLWRPPVRTGPDQGTVYIMLVPGESAGGAPVRARTGSGRSRSTRWTWTAGSRARPLRRLQRGRFPRPARPSSPARYIIQAVVRLNPDTHRIGDGEGNAYGPVCSAPSSTRKRARVLLTVDRIVAPGSSSRPTGSSWSSRDSPKLSDFYHRPIKHRAAVILPARMPWATASVPTVYIIPGFGGDHFMAPLCDRPRTRLRQRLDPGDPRPRLRHGPPRLRRQCDQRPAGKAWSRSSSRTSRRNFPALAEPRARLPERPLLRRLEQPVASGDLSRLLRRHLVDQPRPGRFPRLSADQLYAPGENMFNDRDGQARPIARMGEVRRCSSMTVSRGWTT